MSWIQDINLRWERDEKAEMSVWVDILIIDGVPNPRTFKYKIFSAAYLTARLLYKFSNFSNEVDLEKDRSAIETFLFLLLGLLILKR